MIARLGDCSNVMLILASGSPRRRELLERAEISFTAVSADIPEVRQHGETPAQFARRLAREKAEAVLQRLETPAATKILGADTIVVADDAVLGKPRDDDDGARMLALLSGREHRVITAVCLLIRDEAGAVQADVRDATTVVHFRQLTEAEIESYVRTGEPRDKAGAYAIQGGAAGFVNAIDGDYDNVVGLPVKLVRQMLNGE